MTEGPYKLPDGWRWVKLGEVCEINPRRPRLHRDGNTPTTFVPMNAVDEASGTISVPQTRSYNEVSRGYTYFEEGDVLFAKITPCMENGKAAIARGLLDGIGFGSTEFHVLRPDMRVMAEWVWLFVRQERFRVAAKTAFRGGVGQQRVPQDFLMTYLIPLPPLSDQRRIVARIEEVMALVREARQLREEAKKDAERLMQAALAEVFPRPGADLAPNWRWVRLGEVVEHRRRSIEPRCFPDETFILYSIPSYDNGMKPEKVEGAQIGSSKLLVETGSCLFSKLNPRLPRAWIVDETAEGYRRIASTEFMPLKPRNDALDLVYLGKLLVSEGFLKQVRADVTGATGSRQRLKPDVVLSAVIPLPPVTEQRRIVAYLDSVQREVKGLKEAQSATKTELQRLEQAILDKAFRGEL